MTIWHSIAFFAANGLFIAVSLMILVSAYTDTAPFTRKKSETKN